MYNFYQGYYTPVINKCKAYKCKEYCNSESNKYCILHEEEMFKLNSSSDDFNSKIKNMPSRSNDVCCRSLNCKETHNLVEDYMIFDDEISYGRWCVR
jgi:hypothetical protein